MIQAKETPKRITLIYTNDTLGTLQPCGCGGRNTGGLPRRATYIQKVLSENPNAIIVESGDLAFAVNPAQPTAQIEAVADAFKYMNYTAVGVGPIDIRMGEHFYKVLKQKGIPVINIDTVETEGAIPYMIKEISGVRVGIAAFGAVPPDRRNDLELLKKRYQAFSDARKQSDILILLDQGNIATDEWLQENRNRLGSPDIIVGGCNRIGLNEPKWVGQTMIVPTSTMGEYVGRVDIVIDNDKKKMTYSRTLIDPVIEPNPDVDKIVQDYVKSQSVQTQTQTQASTNQALPYYPYQTCVGCHPAAYEHWKTTRHSKALSTLLQKEKAIPDCLPCHSDMYRLTKRITVSADQTGGVECMACHANVLPHGAEYKKKGDTEAIKAACLECHTKERSANFEPTTAYERIRHASK
ncbi:MAG TPA: multiheme c-type cytochrome [Armatimonadota bacterium]|nr:multiheme c-type cytochrome [Armatimonadota bacterium]